MASPTENTIPPKKADEEGYIFLGAQDGRPYRCCLWGGKLWLFYWHPDQHWVSYVPITQVQFWRLPNNLPAEHQKLYTDLHNKWAA